MDASIIDVISAIGIPAAISFVLLCKIDKTLSKLTESVIALDALVRACLAKMTDR